MATTDAARRLDELRQYLRPCEVWDAWLEKTGEAPPDLDEMPSVPCLPDPLEFQGRRVEKLSEWPDQREAILAAFRRWVFGSYPPPPERIDAAVLEEHTEDGGATRKEIRLTFGPGGEAKLHFELLLPPSSAKATEGLAGRSLGEGRPPAVRGKEGPFPVFMTQRNHEAWARIALTRGYAAVAYNGCDSHDDSAAFKDIWPDHDWSMLCRRAWAAGRVLDWLHTLPYIDREHACITGHSRNGKLSLICGAIDERFTAVISSSSGVGGATPYRLANEAHFAEGIELITWRFKEWLHPRLRFFTGREDRLPVDANLLLALSAPRAVLVSTAFNDSVECARANEVAVRSARRAWSLWGPEADDRLRILWRAGAHETRAEQIECYLDWCDLHFGRAEGPAAGVIRERFRETSYYPYTFDRWRAQSATDMRRAILDPDALPECADLKERIRFLLGEEPPAASRPSGRYGSEKPHVTRLLGRPPVGGESGMACRHLNFGEYIAGDIYVPASTVEEVESSGTKLPAAVWLPPRSTASGYSAGYIRGGRPPAPLVRAGFAVLAYDPVGTGGRLHEETLFYDRHPRWSLLGKMVHDARRAIDVLCRVPWIDAERVFLVGFGVGATTALVAGALDERVAGVASVCGFSPFRTDTPGRPTGGLARYALWEGYGLIPRLGFFADSPEHARRVPVDFDEILAAIAPRHLLCVTPTRDREANHADVCETLSRVREVYESSGAADRFWWYAPVDHRRYAPEIQEVLYAALREAAGL